MVARKILERVEKKLGMSFEGIETNIEKRWEKGIPHHPNSIKIVKAMSVLDYELGGDSLDIKIGGDGDNGEAMMFLLDLYFEAEDKKKNPRGFGFSV